MYCKNCGRQLKEGARFCDRCGQSVRQNNQPSEREAKRREIENLKEERLNRKKRIEYKEAREERKKEKKKSRKKGYIVLVFVFAIMLLALVSALISYHMNISNDKTPLGSVTAETAAPATPAPTAIINQVAVPPVQNNNNGSENKNDDDNKGDNDIQVDDNYEIFKMNNIVCPYPKGFAPRAVSGNVKLNLADSLGGATMTVSVESNVTASTTDMMRDYASQTGGSVIDSRAGSAGFSVTSERDNIVYHRKCMVDGTNIVYYDFQYSVGSSRAQEYKENIAYIDSIMDSSESENAEQ